MFIFNLDLFGIKLKFRCIKSGKVKKFKSESVKKFVDYPVNRLFSIKPDNFSKKIKLQIPKTFSLLNF